MGINHYENFPVASVLCPPALRPAIAAIYHFARSADDLADEGQSKRAQRLADLAAYRADLDAVFAGAEPSTRWAAIFSALAEARQRHDLPKAPLAALLSAFEQDVENPPYPSRAALVAYCERSAQPVGRLLLHLYGLGDDAASQRQSDAVCTALQLINFWQDLSVDLPRGRRYVSDEDARRHGVSVQMLHAGRDTPQTQALVKDLCGWARSLMLDGAPLALRVPGRAGWELRLVVQGGLRIVEKIERMRFATLMRRPTLTPRDAPLLLWRAWRMGAAAQERAA